MFAPARTKSKRVRGAFWRASLIVGLIVVPRSAAAAITCDAGTVCPDKDNDGFAACGCPWSGTPCDCNDEDPTTFPGAPETCDSTKDTNCTGVAPDRCPKQKGCYASACVPICPPLDDFGCGGGAGFYREPGDGGACLCAPIDCTIYGCPAGLVCDDSKSCVPICGPGIRCPYGQICRGLGCVDPCAEVTCPEGAVCTGGRCLPSCSCDPAASCPPGKTCDSTGPVPACVDPGCVGVQCPSGAHCERGQCLDDCEGVVCPTKSVCRKVSVNGGPGHARCVDLCSPNPCKPGFTCEWRTGTCKPIPLPDGGFAAPPELLDPLEVAGAGWLCSASALRGASTLGALAGVGAMIALTCRRRPRRPGR